MRRQLHLIKLALTGVQIVERGGQWGRERVKLYTGKMGGGEMGGKSEGMPVNILNKG